MSSDVRAAEAAQPKEEKLLKWLLHDQRLLGLLIEKFAHEQGVDFLKQLVVLLAQYRGECTEMVCAILPDALRLQLEAELAQPPLASDASEQTLELSDRLEEAFASYRRHGFFPFVLYLSDEELANLLQQEQAINCLLVFDGLSLERQSRVMALLDAEKNAEILNSYDALAAIRYAQYELLAVSLFARSVANRTAQQVVGQNITEIIKSIASQSLERQATIMEDLRTKNKNLYEQMRTQLVLWSDLQAFATDELRAALAVFNSSELLELLKGDLATQALLLPLRPAREQILLKEQLQNQTEPSPETEALRKQLLASLYPFWNQAVSSNTSNNP
jgi:flagellar motor switch protein FliG